jgi:hypothetical protein
MRSGNWWPTEQRLRSNLERSRNGFDGIYVCLRGSSPLSTEFSGTAEAVPSLKAYALDQFSLYTRVLHFAAKSWMGDY